MVIRVTIALILLTFQAQSQGYLTIGEIFNFEIGDRFQYTVTSATPNARRATVTDKVVYGNDSVQYELTWDNYSTYVDWGVPGYLSYSFDSIVETVVYKDLDSSITYMNPSFLCQDTTLAEFEDTIYTNSCGILINEVYTSWETSQDPVHGGFSIHSWGSGVGLFKKYTLLNGTQVFSDLLLFFYEKNGVSCGDEDFTALGQREYDTNIDLELYPNPATERVILKPNASGGPWTYSIFNDKRQIIAFGKFGESEESIDTTLWPAGTYVAVIQTAEGQVGTTKLVVGN